MRIVEKYCEILESLGETTSVLQMAELPETFMYDDSFGGRTANFEDIIHEKIVPARGFVIVAPEYNGSYPGIFKV
ncbi:MAG: NAD(P)H-dependent oxidoreductase, partial [Owenweeksia sp.]